MRFTYILLFLLFISATLPLSNSSSSVKLSLEQLTENISIIVSDEGNIGISHGEEGLIMIDALLSKHNKSLDSLLKANFDLTIGFLINTHHHSDHVGGNELFKSEGAVIVAHENVRKHLTAQNFPEFIESSEIIPSPNPLPTITFQENMRFYLNGDTIDLIHPGPAHTDSDIMIHFRIGNVLFTGDIYLHNMYPNLDLTSGANVDGYLLALEKAVQLSNKKTVIIPGHGELGNYQSLVDYKTMVKFAIDFVKQRIAEKITLKKIIKEGLPKGYGKQYNHGKVSEEKFLTVLYTFYK